MQGFCSDGNRYSFLAVTNDGEVFESAIFECSVPDHLKTIFNWIVSIHVTSVKSSPPTQPGQTQKDEISDIADTVFVQRFEVDEDDTDYSDMEYCF